MYPKRWRLKASLVFLGFCLLVPEVMRSVDEVYTVSWRTSPKTHKQLGSDDNYFYPKWEGKRIVVEDLLAFIYATAGKLGSTVENEKTRLRFPETLYVLDEKGLWVSFNIRTRSWKPMIEARIHPSEFLMREAWRIINLEWTSDEASQELLEKTRWPCLSRALYKGEGVPWLAWYGDYRSCNFHNWGNRSIPLFTNAVPITCHNGFPMPNYKLYGLSKETREEWQAVTEEYRTKYPSWEHKIPKAVWRGSLSAPNDDLQSVRWRLCKLAAESNTTSLDVGLVSIPARNAHLNLSWDIIGGKSNPIPQEDFQQYAAIIDVDGNSWSSRFAELLCYNSVVLKVEPQFVEYFYEDLEPWIHYIPVHDDLSDLVQHAEYATDPRNRQHIQQIVLNANAWCHTSLVKRRLGEDFLDLLDAYTEFLDLGDPEWTSKWSIHRETIFHHETFDMRQIL